MVAWNKLYRAELFHTLRYAEGKRYEDMFLLPNLIGQCRKILCLNFRGYRYAQRTGSIMSRLGLAPQGIAGAVLEAGGFE